MVVEGCGVDFGCGLEVCCPHCSESEVGVIGRILIDAGLCEETITLWPCCGADLWKAIPM